MHDNRIVNYALLADSAITRGYCVDSALHSQKS